MALDKNRILSELGSVVNQLQSADCGCMGKLFSGSGGQAGMRGMGGGGCGGMPCGYHRCCHGHGDSMGGHCMRGCHAPKLYSDTFNYLNNNLMQPTMKEVYDELSTISPQNTISNSPMANQMGIPVNGGAMGGSGMGGDPMTGGAMTSGAMGNGGMGGNPMSGGAMGVGGMSGGSPMSGGAMGGGGMMGGGPMGGEAMTVGHMSGSGMGGSAFGGMGGMGGGPMSNGGMGGGPMGVGAMGGGSMGGGAIGEEAMNMSGDGGMGSGGMDGGMNNNAMGGGAINTPSGMGAHIMQMMMSGGRGKPKMSPLQGPPGGSMPMGGSNSPGQYYTENMGTSQGDQNTAGFDNQYAVPKTEYVTQDNMFTVQNAPPPENAQQNMNAEMNPAMTMNQQNLNMHPGINMNPGANMNNAMNMNTGMNMSRGMNMNPGINMNPAQNANAIMPQQGTGFANQGLGAMNPQKNAYGVHSAGVSKFNEMFSGLMSGQNLGFDPMAIAVQMNPANQRQAAINQMQNVLFNKPGANLQNALIPGQPLGVGQSQQLAPGQQQMTPVQQQLMPGQQQLVPGQQQLVPGQQQLVPIQQQLVPVQQQLVPGQQQMVPGQQQMVAVQQHLVPSQQQIAPGQQMTAGQPLQAGQQGLQQNQQQVYAAQSGNIAPQGQYQQQAVDPNTESAYDPNSQYQQEPAQGQTHETYKEHILPAEPTKNPMYRVRKPEILYNMLGQPVEMLPGSPYIEPKESPRALFLSEAAAVRPTKSKAQVKSTVSKTSIVGNKPVGRTPSRAQLHNIYEQYKGSQSYTQPKVIPVQGTTHSDGGIRDNANARRVPQQQIQVEKVGGDSSANNMNSVPVNKIPAGQIGDVAPPTPNKPDGDSIKKPEMQSYRNGMQDMKHSKYSRPMWTFHGERDAYVSAMASKLGRRY